jgi:CRP/FNR family cyclic AMP-dependent transcriptional regulator
MAAKRRQSFDPKSLLARVGDGRSIAKHRKGEVVFSQAGLADAVFYIQCGKVNLTVVSEQGKEAVVAIPGPGEFFGEGCLAGQVQRTATASVERSSSERLQDIMKKLALRSALFPDLRLVAQNDIQQ